MANPEHLAILKLGVEAWNKWRNENPEIVPELSESNLIGIDLRGVNLRGANLSRTSLKGAFIWKSNLVGANLNEAVLWLTNLSGSNLEGANLKGALLKDTFLQEANFSYVKVGFSSFNGVDLGDVNGLETVRHEAPSSIGVDTIYKSNGNIPKVFLRDCGVPDQMIEYLHSLTSPIEYSSCFISYSHKDEEFAKLLWKDLQANNVRCWYAPHDLKIGDKIRPTIEESIRVYDKLLLILSVDSVNSKWVKHEVEHALDHEIKRDKTILFPVRVDNTVMNCDAGWATNIKDTRNIGDFTRWKDHDAYQKAFTRLLRDLKA